MRKSPSLSKSKSPLLSPSMTPKTPVETTPKIFRRKQDVKANERIISRERREKKTVEVSAQKICFIPNLQHFNAINQFLTENKNTSQDSTKKINRNRTKSQHKLLISDSKKKQACKRISPMVEQEVQEVKVGRVEMRREHSWLKNELDKHRKELNEFRNSNEMLMREVKNLKLQNEQKHENIYSLNVKVRQLNETIRQNRRKFEDKNRQIRKLQKMIQEQRQSIHTLETTIQKKQKQLSSLMNEKNRREELERALSEINNFDDELFIGEKTPEVESGISRNELEMELKQEQIMSLNERIKYQQIQIGMLKRYKAEAERNKNQLEKQKLQNKLLLAKLRTLSAFSEEKGKGRKKKVEDYSISFELSDEISVM